MCQICSSSQYRYNTDHTPHALEHSDQILAQKYWLSSRGQGPGGMNRCQHLDTIEIRGIYLSDIGLTWTKFYLFIQLSTTHPNVVVSIWKSPKLCTLQILNQKKKIFMRKRTSLWIQNFEFIFLNVFALIMSSWNTSSRVSNPSSSLDVFIMFVTLLKEII